MKNFIEDEGILYKDESDDGEDREDGEEIYQMKSKKKKSIKVSKFDENNYDIKVAKAIINIHRNKKDNKFSKWVNINYKHLENLYRLSDLTIPRETFFTYIYDHSAFKKY